MMNDQERLEAFERMLSAVQKSFEDTSARMERLRAEGKSKSATYRQLMGNKLMYQNMLAMYALYDLIEKENTADSRFTPLEIDG